MDLDNFDRKSWLGLGIVGAALLLGLLGNGLLRATPWGINAFLWIVALTAAGGALFLWQEIEWTGGGRWVLFSALFFAGAMAWRDSPTLNFLNFIAVLASLALVSATTRQGRVLVGGIFDYIVTYLHALFYATLGALFLILTGVEWKTIRMQKWGGSAMAVGRGLFLALPLMVLFGGLFMAADAVFETMVFELVDLDIEQLMGHLVGIGFWGYVSGGFLYQLLLAKPINHGTVSAPAFMRLGMIEAGIVLGTLNLLFLAFVLVQFRYFFGGVALVEQSIDLTYADYARRGFFELVTVAALVLPLLLVGHWLLGHQEASRLRLFRLLSTTLIAMLYIIMLSAVQRMRLYQSEFGLTELRLYTTAFMGWLALLFLWFGLTVLRGRRELFAFGGMTSAFGVLVLLLLLNPDGLIARTNAGRATAPRPFDSRYVISLSADAVPDLLAALPEMKEEDRCRVSAGLLRKWATPDRAADWRNWNWSRARARQLVREQQTALETMLCP